MLETSIVHVIKKKQHFEGGLRKIPREQFFFEAWRSIKDPQSGNDLTAISFDWFTVLSPSFLIGQSNYFGFGFTTIDWNSLYTTKTRPQHCQNHVLPRWTESIKPWVCLSYDLLYDLLGFSPLLTVLEDPGNETKHFDPNFAHFNLFNIIKVMITLNCTLEVSKS